MVKVEEQTTEMDCIEGNLKALLKAEKEERSDIHKQLALVVRELEKAKAEVDEAKNLVEAAHQQADDAIKEAV